jgi:acetoacetyl-CoA synthetase
MLPVQTVLASDAMPGATWFPDARLNFAEHLVGGDDSLDQIAIVAHSQTREPAELSFAGLRDQVARARAGLLRLGVGPGDRVVAYMPNIPETLVAFAATASIGAVFASCAPELGARSVVDRLAQLEPAVLLAVGGYGFRDRSIDRRDEVATIRAALPTLRHVVHVPYGDHALSDALSWDELLAEPGPLAFEPVAFDHPLFVLFSSGTTARPKAIVHGHGGILLEYLKAHSFSWDLKPGGRLLWFRDLVDDVERARRGADRALVDRDDRRRPDLARSGLAVAPRGGDAPDLHGSEPRLPDGVPQGRPRAGARVRPRLDPGLRHRRLSPPDRGLPLPLRPARA